MASNPFPLGKVAVTAAATRERLTKGLSAPTASLRCQKIHIKASLANTGDVTVGDVTVVASTGVGAYIVLDAGQEHTFVIDNAPNGLDASLFYLDVGTSGDSVIAYLITQ
jgi:hypothetical protein